MFGGIGDQLREAQVVTNLGITSFLMGDNEAAERELDEALALHTELGNDRSIGIALQNKARVVLARGRREQALALFEQAVERLRGHGVLSALGNLALLHAMSNRPDLARPIFDEVLEIQVQTGDRVGQAHTLGNLGLMENYQGHIAMARQHYTAALAMHREVGDREGIALMSHNLGGVMLDDGDLVGAARVLGDSLEVYRQLGDPRGEAMVESNLAVLAEHRDRPAEARAHYMRGLLLADQTPGDAYVASLHCGLGYADLRDGAPRAGLKHFMAAIEVAVSAGDSHWEARGRLGAGMTYLALDDLALGREQLELVEPLSAGLAVIQGRLCCARAQLKLREGDFSAAAELVQKAEHLADASGPRPAVSLQLDIDAARTLLGM
jgi:tetratricopeptide (TPR) repeat protein